MYPSTLTNLQLEIIKLYSTSLEQQELLELKQLLANFFARKAIQEADQIWSDKNLKNADMDDWLAEE
ncbi:MAG: hypothetical protein KC423_08215 [Anaerolineales bacterium]|nr:hypothetical protein [Anaerolineales bacterium]